MILPDPLWRIYILVLLLVLAITRGAFGQRDIINFKHIDDAAGLPNNRFRTMIQDREGLLWMAGGDGLAYYDGINFGSLRHTDSDSTSISGNNISAIFEDASGRLWVATYDGELNVSDLTKTHFRTVQVANTTEGRSFLTVINQMAQDAKGRIWAVSNTGLTIIHEQEGRFTSVTIDELITAESSQTINELITAEGDQAGVDSAHLVLAQPRTVFCDRGDSVLIGTSRGLYLYVLAENMLVPPSGFADLADAAIQFIGRDRQDRIWVSVRSSVARLFYSDLDMEHFTPFEGIPFKSTTANVTFAFDLDNRLWATEFGVQAYAYDFRDSSLFLESRVNSSTRTERFVRNPFVDHSGNVWIHARGYLMYPYPKNFNTYYHPFAFRQANTFTFEDDAYWWFGYWEEGVVRIDRKTGESIRFHKGSMEFSLPSNLIMDIVKARSGNLVAVAFGTIVIMNPSGQVVAEHRLRGANRAGFVDSKGRIWIGGISGLHLFTEKSGVIKSYTLPARYGDRRNFIQTIVEDSHGNIWFGGGFKGLAMLDTETDSITQFLPDENDPASLPSEHIHDILIDRNSDMWIATDVGLVYHSLNTAKFETYNTENGIPNDFIQSIIEDHVGVIWVSTNSGISSFNAERKVFYNYNRNDGLSNGEYTSRGGYLAEDGMIYFGGEQGVDYFSPEDLRINPTPPIMRLTGITIDNETLYSMAELKRDGGRLELSYANNLIEIGFVGMHFVPYGRVDHYYMMEGLNDEWIKLGEGRSVLYVDLDPGNYIFRAKSRTSNHIWSESELAIPIHIAPPFYGTLWFKLTIATSAILLLLFIMKYREKRIEKKQRIEAELKHRFVELETRALRAQMNPHFIYNCLNSIQHFMVTEEYKPAMDYLTRFSRVLRSVLGASGQSRLPLAEEIRMVEDYLELEQMRFPKSFSYSITVDPALNIHSVEIPPFFIQPQVENAIRHGLLHKNDRSRIDISINKNGDCIHIIVEDNGVGRDAARDFKLQSKEVHKGKGLAIIEERLAHMNYAGAEKRFQVTDLYNAEGEPTGTRVEVVLPID